MGIAVIIMASIVLVLCVVVVAVILLQSSRDSSMGSTINGGADKLFGGKDKQRARTIDEKLAKATPYITLTIGVLIIALNFIYIFLK